MPVPNASLTPDETVQWSPTGPAALALTTAGALRVQRPRGPLVQAGTVNLVLNPKGNSGAYSAAGATTVTTYTDDNGYTVTRVVRSAAGYVVPASKAVPTIAAGSVITVSFDVRAVRANGTAGMGQPYCTWGATTAPTAWSGYVPSQTWQRIWFTIAVGATAISTMYFSWDNLAITNGDWFEVRKPQVEYGASVGEYVDGDVADDTYWIAAANNSPSVRPDRYAELPNAWLVEEGATNLITNPVCANNADGWVDMGGGGSVASAKQHTVNDPRFGGLNSFGYELLTAGSYFGIRNAPITMSGESVTVSAQALCWSNVPARCRIYILYTDATATIFEVGTIAPFTTVHHKSTVTSVAGKTVASVDIRIDIVTQTVGAKLAMTAGQIETKAYPTSLAVSTMGTGYSAGAGGVSVRAASRIFTPATFDLITGSVYVRFMADNPRPNLSYLLQRGAYGNAGSDFLGLRIYNGAIQIISRAGTAADQYASSIVSPSGVMSAYVEYTPSTIKLFVNGVGAGQVTSRNAPIGDLKSWDIGSWNGDSHANAYTFAVLIFPRPLSAAERSALESIPTENLSYASIVGIGPQLGGLLLTHPDPGFAVLRTHGGT